ncbi:MAG: hypothetical protein V2I47_03215 [Bacteroidales bacterium]|jgi:hypothetical protein|nr:hypothetical protein [Bacteroidales bacterium]
MKFKLLLYTSLMTMVMLSIPVFSNAQVFIDAESGAVFTGYNDVRIPGDSGTTFSLKDDLEAKPAAFIRLKAGITIRSRHTISVLFAPLKIKSEGLSEMDIDFNGVRFPNNTQLNATYKFNSYRITYRYDIVKRPKFEFGLGFTAKIRDAEISLSDEGTSSSKKNVGFVPIINFRLYWKIHEKFGLLLEGDALAAPQGRAEDVLLAGTYKLSDHFLFRAGYRILEGGADNDEVYNFALIHYASFGITFTF